MLPENFSPAGEIAAFRETNGEDSFNKINLLYIASMLYKPDSEVETEDFDRLCEDLLDLSLDEAFDGYTTPAVVKAAKFIMKDSSYTVPSYARACENRRDRVTEELLYLLDKWRAERNAK